MLDFEGEGQPAQNSLWSESEEPAPECALPLLLSSRKHSIRKETRDDPVLFDLSKSSRHTLVQEGQDTEDLLPRIDTTCSELGLPTQLGQSSINTLKACLEANLVL